jgi:hypothetical protein
MNRINQNHITSVASDSPTPPAKSASLAANLKSLTAAVLLLLVFLILTACDPTALAGLPVPPATQLPAPASVTPGTSAAVPAPSDTPLASNPPAPADTSAPAVSPTALPATPTEVGAAASTPTTLPGSSAPSTSVVNAIKSVIQRGNEEEVQAFASNDPSVMADTSTTAYYQQMVQSFSDMTSSGITAVKLVNLTWGPITLQDANTAQANTTEAWLTTFSDGSTTQETDPNVYTLVLQGGQWKVQDDQHPNTRTLQPQPGTPGTSGTPGVAVTPNPNAPAPIASAIPPGTSVEQSSNWAGYTASGGTFTAVAGNWIVPNVSAGTGNAVAADATWVGIGGANSTDLIQAGTQATLQGGQVVYTAWWETLPQAAQTVPLDVAAGDSVSVSITQQSDGTWEIQIHDSTSGQSFQKKLTYRSSRSSAEWIEESPSVGGRTLIPLDNFGTVTFTNATAVENGKQSTIAQAGGQPINMYSSPGQGRRGRFGQPGGQAGQPLAQPSALGADGSSFSVTRTNVPAPVVVP